MLQILQNALGIRTRIESTGNKTILLTFDDGPDPAVTGQVLDALDKHEAKAVFFVVGDRINKAEHMLEEVLQRGHLLGNHSYCHWLGQPPGYQEYLADLLRCQERIFEVSGYTPTLFRPPLGTVTTATIRASRKLKFDICKWSLDSNDWRLRDDTAARARAAEIAGEVNDRDIFLFHDNNPHTPVLLNDLLPRLHDAEYDMGSFVDNYKQNGAAFHYVAGCHHRPAIACAPGLSPGTPPR